MVLMAETMDLPRPLPNRETTSERMTMAKLTLKEHMAIWDTELSAPGMAAYPIAPSASWFQTTTMALHRNAP